MAPMKSHCSLALVCLVTSATRNSQMGLVVQSDWLLQLLVKGISMQESPTTKEHLQKSATAESLVGKIATAKLSANETQKSTSEVFS